MLPAAIRFSRSPLVPETRTGVAPPALAYNNQYNPKREKARKWYWKNRNAIGEEHKQGEVVLVEEGKV